MSTINAINFLIIFIIFLFGLCVGSFLNVLIYRLPHSLPITGFSFCPKCKKRIIWQDNIPLVSFICLGGKCRFCHSPISFQYPLVELATGILTVFLFWFYSYNFFYLIFYLLIFYALLVVFVSDWRYQIVPDQVIYPAIAISLLKVVTFEEFRLNFLLSGFGAGLFFLILYFATLQKGMGMGDIKLAFLMGLILGFPKIILALYLSFLTGAFFGVILILVGKKRFGEHVPFGPFLCGATFVSLFWGEEIIKWLAAQFF
jgi:leader peptidase (prepilin peptidase)/N-methyltransferase